MSSQSSANIEIQGHRGCRGYFPENTIEACIGGLKMGATTLEIDVVISKDSQVVVSHEPYFSRHISTHPEGIEITKENEQEYNLYLLSISEIQQFDVGLKVHPDFPDQKPGPAFKPTLQQLADAIHTVQEQLSLPKVRWNIEIKRNPAFDGITHPEPETFVQLVVSATQKAGLSEACNFQSFDPKILQILKKSHPQFPLAYLVHIPKLPEEHFEELGFVPHIYSPHYGLVTENTVNACHDKGVRIIPWTVNDKEAIQKMVELHVDGIISDYPDRVIQVIEGNNR